MAEPTKTPKPANKAPVAAHIETPKVNPPEAKAASGRGGAAAFGAIAGAIAGVVMGGPKGAVAGAVVGAFIGWLMTG